MRTGIVARLQWSCRRNSRTLLRLAGAAAVLVVGWFALDALLSGYTGPKIRFYGRLIDRDGRPVAGQVVDIEVWRKTSPLAQHGMGRGVEPLQLTATTAADGRFAIRGIRGVEVRVRRVGGLQFFFADDPRRTPGPFIYDDQFRRDASLPGPVYEPNEQRPAVFVVRQVP